MGGGSQVKDFGSYFEGNKEPLKWLREVRDHYRYSLFILFYFF